MVSQSELKISRTAGLTRETARVWTSTGVTPSTWYTTYAYETDVGFDVARSFGSYEIDAGSWIAFLNPRANTDVPALDVKVGHPFTSGRSTINPFAEVQWYGTTDAKSAGYHGGVYPMAGAEYRTPLTEHIVLALQARTSYDALGGFGKRQGGIMLSTESSLTIPLANLLVAMAHAGLVGSFNDMGRPWAPVFNVGFIRSF